MKRHATHQELERGVNQVQPQIVTHTFSAAGGEAGLQQLMRASIDTACDFAGKMFG